MVAISDSFFEMPDLTMMESQPARYAPNMSVASLSPTITIFLIFPYFSMRYCQVKSKVYFSGLPKVMILRSLPQIQRQIDFNPSLNGLMRILGRGQCLDMKYRSLRDVIMGIWPYTCWYLFWELGTAPSGVFSKSMMTWQHSYQRLGQFSTMMPPIFSIYLSILSIFSLFSTRSFTSRALSSRGLLDSGTASGKIVQYSSTVMYNGISQQGRRSASSCDLRISSKIVEDQSLNFFRGVTLTMI